MAVSEEAPESSGDGDTGDTSDHATAWPEMQLRSANVSNIDFPQRIITVLAAPYEEPAPIEFRSEVWKEVFTRGAFDGVRSAPHRIKVNREHEKGRTVGKVIDFPFSNDGLVAEVRIAKTALGDETLALAEEECIGASVGYAARPGNTRMDRYTMTRRVNQAFLNHLSFVEDPAYVGAKVLSVRSSVDFVDSATLEPLRTPNLDELIAEMNEIREWTRARLNKQ